MPSKPHSILSLLLVATATFSTPVHSHGHFNFLRGGIGDTMNMHRSMESQDKLEFQEGRFENIPRPQQTINFRHHVETLEGLTMELQGLQWNQFNAPKWEEFMEAFVTSRVNGLYDGRTLKHFATDISVQRVFQKDSETIVVVYDQVFMWDDIPPEDRLNQHDSMNDPTPSLLATMPFARSSDKEAYLVMMEAVTRDDGLTQVTGISNVGLATPQPTDAPSGSPTMPPSSMPSDSPSMTPSIETPSPTAAPTVTASAVPTDMPSSMPSDMPSMTPTLAPTGTPSGMPIDMPSMTPTTSPSTTPSFMASDSPSMTPTGSPTVMASDEPTVEPTMSPTVAPSVVPTADPTASPTTTASDSPTEEPTLAPTPFPTTLPPTPFPTTVPPTPFPTTLPPIPVPTARPTPSPTIDPNKIFFCPDDARVCPDGSSVMRNADRNCDFDPCPPTSSEGGTTTDREVVLPDETVVMDEEEDEVTSVERTPPPETMPPTAMESPLPETTNTSMTSPPQFPLLRCKVCPLPNQCVQDRDAVYPDDDNVAQVTCGMVENHAAKSVVLVSTSESSEDWISWDDCTRLQHEVAVQGACGGCGPTGCSSNVEA